MNKYKEALEELRKLERAYNFKNIGQVAPQVNCDVLQELLDKATPKKVIEDKTHPISTFYCPNCQKEFDVIQWHDEYCSFCGQRIDWSDEE